MTVRRELGGWRGRRATGGFATSITDLAGDIAQQRYGSSVPVLRALLTISHAVLEADFFDEALEVIAEQSLRALDAASLSISRWEPADGILRTLINVGRLGPGEERWPDAEIYPVQHSGHVTRLLQHGRPYLNSIHDPDADDAELAVLRLLEKESEVAVPVMYDDVMWGELWASGVGARRFGPDDVQLLQAIAAHVSVAIGRAELFSTVWRYSYEDPLTQLANRRGLDAYLDAVAGTAGEQLVVAVCDLDGFKDVNDRYGHPVGDDLLRHVAGALRTAADSVHGSMVARLGGDEFCVVLPAAGRSDMERVMRRVGDAVNHDTLPRVALTWGVATTDTPAPNGNALIAAADAVMVAAKRARGAPSRLDVARADTGAAAPDLVTQVLAAFDRQRPASVLDALTRLAEEVAAVADISAWSVVEATEGAGELRVRRTAAPLGPAADLGPGVTVTSVCGPTTFELGMHQHTHTAALTAMTPQLRVLAHYCTQFAADRE